MSLKKSHVFVFLCCVFSSSVIRGQDTIREIDIEGPVITTRRAESMLKINPLSGKMLPDASGGIEAMIKTLPGVSSNNELTSQYSVRGGNYDENLVYVNDVEIYRPFLIRSGEQEGLSFINPALVASLQFSAGGFDAKYGDKMSSVLDIRYKKPQAFAGSASLDLLGAAAHVEGLSKNENFTYLFSVRQKSNQYLLQSMSTKGNYKPSFTDIQTLLTYRLNAFWQLEFLGNYARNKYQVTPESSYTKFGTIGQPMRLYIAFDGQEVDRYNTLFGATTLTYSPAFNKQHRLTVSAFQSKESETFDIFGAYLLTDGDSEETGTSGMQGVGSYLNHARNYLDAIVFSANYQGRYMSERVLWTWGFKYQREDIIDELNEWKMVDSTGFTLPIDPVNPGVNNPKNPPALQNVYKSDNHMISNRFNAFVQANVDLTSELTVHIGTRFAYWDFNSEFLFSPRVSLSYMPEIYPNLAFRLASGVYYQPPFYRELRDMKGELNTDIKSQRSIHIVGGMDYFLNIWGRPFKFVSEVYYKALKNLIPYELDNLRVRYLAQNNSKGYAAGVDLRLHGEFVKGIESWASLSFLTTQESIDGQPYVPRPTDQRVNFNLYFQDYLTANENMKVHLNLVFGTGVPYGNPKALEDSDLFQNRSNFRLPAYRRVDIGFSYQIKAVKKAKMWISAEIFNLFDINNTISYTWVSDVSGTQYGVANYLTPRLLNVRLAVDF